MMRFRFKCAGIVLALLLTVASHAQVQVVSSLITTFAGDGPGCTGQTDSIGDGCPSTGSVLRSPTGAAVDSAGNLYIADANDGVIRKVSAATGEITTVAGTVLSSGFSGDKGPATSATFSTPVAVAVDAAGDLFIVDQGNVRIREISAATGDINTIAGNGSTGYTGDNNQATNATFKSPFGIAVNPAGTLVYIADSGNNVVRLVNLTTGIITTYAGNGTEGNASQGSVGDGGQAASAELANPAGVSLDANGNLYIADTYDSEIREVTKSTGIINTVAGYLGSPNYGGDGGPATKAFLYYPSGVTVDSFGNIFIADTYNCLIREVKAATGIITTVAGNTQDAGLGEGRYGGDNGPATLGLLNLPDEVAVDSNGNLFIADTQNNAIRKVGAPNSHLELPATAVASASAAQNIQLYITDWCLDNNCFANPEETSLTISSVTVAKSVGGSLEFTVGTLSGCKADGTTPVNAGSICTVPITFNPAYPGLQQAPLELVTNAGTFYFGLSGIGMGPQPALLPGVVSTVAGTGADGYTGDNGPATSATFAGIFAVAVDYAGNQYIDDYNNDIFRKVTAATGIVTTFAGDGTEGYTGDNGPATGAEIDIDWNAGSDAAGNVYIADTNNNVIREVNAVTGIITTVVGDCCSFTGTGLQGYNGDGIAATTAELFFPQGVVTDTSGNLYIADYGNNRIRELNAATGTISTVAGTGFGDGATGTGGYTGDNGPATSAELNGPGAIAIDSAGNFYIADFYNSAVRKVTAATGVITTVAGDGTHGDTGDNGPATSAEVGSPIGLTVDAAGDLYIVSSGTSGEVVRKVDAATGIITTVAGGGTGCTGQTDSVGDGCGATSASVGAQNIAIDSAGNLYIADGINNRVREVSLKTAPITFPQTAVNSTSAAITFKVANIGNAPLTLSSISPTANFSVDSGTTTCSTSDTVPAGGSCEIGVVFSPTAGGSLSGTLTLTDNALNVTGTTQQVALNGSIQATGGTTTPTVTVSPSPSSITTAQADTVTVGVSGGSGNPTPTGTVTLTSGSYTSAPATLVSGSAMITVPAGSLATGTDTLSATYTPDSASSSTYNSATGSNTVTVTTAVSGPTAGLAPSPVTFTGQVVGTTSEAIAVTLSNTGTATLLGITPTITGTNPTDFAISSGPNSCDAAVSPGSSCIIYVTFTPASAASVTASLSVADNAPGSPQTVTLNGTGVAFVSNVGTALPVQPVSVSITTAGTASAINVLTQGATNLDFTESSGGTCATGTAYTVGEICTVNVIFTPQVPGARLGSVFLTDAGGHTLGTTYLPGVGNGPEIVFSPGAQSTPPSNGYSGPLQDTVDAAQNLYVADSLNGRIIKIPWNGTSYGTPIKLPFVGLNQPYAVAVDGSGNVFVADSMNYQVVELPWNGSSYGTQIVLDSTGLPAVAGIAVDGNGNLFFTDQIDQKLVEMPMTSGGYGAPAIISAASGLHAPHGVTVDANLNIYIADSGDSRVVEIPWNGSSFGTEIVVPTTGLFYPEALAVDAAGDVYIADSDHGQVDEVPWNGSSFGTQVAVPFTLPGTAITTGLAVDGYGNLYVVDGGDNAVDELSRSTPPSLSFASTNVGSVSSDSPKTVTVTNIGNAGFYMNAATNNPVYPADFPINNSDANLCEEDDSLYIGRSCDISVNFKPTASGPLAEDVVLTDNDLNGSNVMTSIPVSGTGVGGSLTAQTINFTQPTTPVTYSSGLTISLVATGGASGNPVVFTIDGSSSGTGTITGSTLTVTGVGSFVIDANQAGNSTYSAAPQVQRTVAVNQASQTINFTQPTSPVTYSSGLQITLAATGGASGNPVVFTIDASSTATGSISGSTLTVTSTGNLVIDANQAGNANYSAATQVQRTIVVNTLLAQAINFTQPSTPVTYSSGLTISLVATGGASENPVVFTLDESSTGAGSISGGTLTVTSVGSFVIDANQAGNSTYSAAPQVQRTVVVNQAPQAINFTQPTSPVTYTSGLQITLSATGGASGSPIVFSIDSSSTATGLISGSTLTVTSAGNLVIDANQAGNTDYAAAPQVQRTIMVNAPAPDFGITATPPSQSVQPGGSATYPITVTDSGSSFTSAVTLSVSGLPAGATGTFNPPTVTPGSESGTSTLTVTTAASAGLVRPNLWPMGTPVPALLFMLPFRRWRRLWRSKLLLVVAGLASLAGALSLMGCGGGFGLKTSQTYTLTITGTSGTDTHSTTVQLTVEQ